MRYSTHPTHLKADSTVMLRKMREAAMNCASCGKKHGPEGAPETLRRVSETSFVTITGGTVAVLRVTAHRAAQIHVAE